MTQQISAHLPEEAFYDVLIGLGSAESHAHLAGCDVCRGHLDEFQSSLQTFNQASLAWSQATSEAHPVPMSMSEGGAGLRLFARPATRRGIFAPLGWAVATALLLVLGLQVWNRERQPSLTANMATGNAVAGNSAIDKSAKTSMQSDTEAQIAQDNQLLQSVNMALNTSEASPLQEYGLEDELQPRMKAQPKARHR
jgi:hypothetical protein